MLHPAATLIIDWLQQIGLTVRLAPLEADTFLPGVTLAPGGLIVDPDRLLYPGDLLHEAGHLATMLPEQRTSAGSNVGSDMGAEIAAQTWSYAAAVHLGLPPEMVFHSTGYKGAAASLIQIYCDGSAGVPLLQWMGLTLDSTRAAAICVPPYPHMIRWLRAQPVLAKPHSNQTAHLNTAPRPPDHPKLPAPSESPRNPHPTEVQTAHTLGSWSNE